MLNYRELKRRYQLDGATRTVTHLTEALRKSTSAPRTFRSVIWPKRSSPTATIGCARSTRARRRRGAVGSRRGGRCDRVLEHHRPGGVLEDHGGVSERRVRRQPAGGHDPHAARRRKDPRHHADRRQDRRGAPGHAVSQPRFRRGLHRDAEHGQARLHRAGHSRSHLFRPHAPGAVARRGGRRDARPEQGKAADRHPGRHREQLQVARHVAQYVSDRHAVDQREERQRAGRLDRRG